MPAWIMLHASSIRFFLKKIITEIQHSIRQVNLVEVIATNKQMEKILCMNYVRLSCNTVSQFKLDLVLRNKITPCHEISLPHGISTEFSRQYPLPLPVRHRRYPLLLLHRKDALLFAGFVWLTTFYADSGQYLLPDSCHST